MDIVRSNKQMDGTTEIKEIKCTRDRFLLFLPKEIYFMQIYKNTYVFVYIKISKELILGFNCKFFLKAHVQQLISSCMHSMNM